MKVLTAESKECSSSEDFTWKSVRSLPCPACESEAGVGRRINCHKDSEVLLDSIETGKF